MNGLEFEEFLYNLFVRKGYRVTRTKYNDQGADLIIESYGEKTVVQAKRQKGNISNSAIQEAHAAKSYYKAKKALVICTSNFTKPAKALAEKLKVELWDRQRLLLEIGNINY